MARWFAQTFAPVARCSSHWRGGTPKLARSRLCAARSLLSRFARGPIAPKSRGVKKTVNMRPEFVRMRMGTPNLSLLAKGCLGPNGQIFVNPFSGAVGGMNSGYYFDLICDFHLLEHKPGKLDRDAYTTMRACPQADIAPVHRDSVTR